MPKNIVICCDGTANEFAEDRTNVVKLYYTLEQDPAKQVTFYHPGVGTMEPAGALSPFSRKFTRLLGMAVGYGLSNDIRDIQECQAHFRCNIVRDRLRKRIGYVPFT